MSEPIDDILALKLQLDDLSRMIATTIAEIAVVRHPQGRAQGQDDRVNGAVDELAAIVADTEAATDTILDAAEALEAMARGARGEDGQPLRQSMSAITTRIFEACNFQDLSGQRIAKVTTLLRDIDARLAVIIETIGAGRFDAACMPAMPIGEAALLNGPAKAEEGLEQSLIDGLLN